MTPFLMNRPLSRIWSTLTRGFSVFVVSPISFFWFLPSSYVVPQLFCSFNMRFCPTQESVGEISMDKLGSRQNRIFFIRCIRIILKCSDGAKRKRKFWTKKKKQSHEFDEKGARIRCVYGVVCSTFLKWVFTFIQHLTKRNYIVFFS